MEYTKETGMLRFQNSAAKTLIYMSGDASLPCPREKTVKTKPIAAVPFATFDGSEEGKYPKGFTLRKQRGNGSDKIGGNRDFDPSVYSQQILDNREMKIQSNRKAYVGAGHILSHDGVAPPPSVTHTRAPTHACPYDTDPIDPNEGSGAPDAGAQT